MHPTEHTQQHHHHLCFSAHHLLQLCLLCLHPPLQVKEEVNQLLVQLPQAKNATETFSLFASSVQNMFEGLQHIR